MSSIYLFVIAYIFLAVVAYIPIRRATERWTHGIGFLGSAELSAEEIDKLAELSKMHYDIRKIVKSWIERDISLRARHLHYAEEIADRSASRAQWLAESAVQKAKWQANKPGRARAVAALAASVL